MKLLQIHIEKIRSEYQEISDLEDLLALLNQINVYVYGDSAIKIQLKSLTYYSNPKLATDAYKTFEIPKKNGGVRIIHSPAGGLKSIQGSLAVLFQALFEPHPKATGFVIDKSVVDNAQHHVGKHYVFNIDLKDFFPSVDKPRFWKRLQYPPFNLNKENGRLKLANRIAAICFTNLEVERIVNGEWVSLNKDVLPQGAPSSPVITNIIAYRLDQKLKQLAEHFGCEYSRYADDITFSSDHNVYQKDGEFRKILEEIVRGQNFHLKHTKTRLNRSNDSQEVTGLIVNEKVNVKRRYIKELRHWIYFWERYGKDKAEELILRAYKKDKGHVKKGEPNIENIIYGKLLYLKMVKGSNNGTYKKLQHRFDVIIGKTVDFDPTTLLENWEKDGIESAMKYYYSHNELEKNDKQVIKLNLNSEDLPLVDLTGK
ncbi:MAG: reverse transcriptase family protein [Balneolaceae bacterium]